MPVFRRRGASLRHSSPRAGIMPTSAGSRPDRCRPTAARIEQEGVLIDNVLLVEKVGSAKRDARAPRLGPLACAQHRPQYLRPGGAARRLRARRRSARADGARLRRRRGRSVHGPRPRQCRGGGAAADRPPDDGSSLMRWTMARVSRSRSVDRAARSATFDFTGTSAQLPDNFNAPFSIVRAALLYVMRTLIDEAIPMNDGCLRPIDDHRARRLDAQSALSGRRRRRQCRDQPGRHRRLVRRAWRACAVPGDDEQLHLRQRAPPILRDHRRRLGRGARS